MWLHQHRECAYPLAIHEVVKAEAALGLQTEGACIDRRNEMMCPSRAAARLEEHVMTTVGLLQCVIVGRPRPYRAQIAGGGDTFPLRPQGHCVCPAT